MEVLLQSCFPLALLLTTPLPSTLQPNMASFSEAPYTIPDSTLNCVEQPLHSLTSSTYVLSTKNDHISLIQSQCRGVSLSYISTPSGCESICESGYEYVCCVLGCKLVNVSVGFSAHNLSPCFLLILFWLILREMNVFLEE